MLSKPIKDKTKLTNHLCVKEPTTTCVNFRKVFRTSYFSRDATRVVCSWATLQVDKICLLSENVAPPLDFMVCRPTKSQGFSMFKTRLRGSPRKHQNSITLRQLCFLSTSYPLKPEYVLNELASDYLFDLISAYKPSQANPS